MQYTNTHKLPESLLEMKFIGRTVMVVFPENETDEELFDFLNDLYAQMLGSEPEHVWMLDLSAVKSFPPTYIGLLLAIKKNLLEINSRMHIINPKPWRKTFVG